MRFPFPEAAYLAGFTLAAAATAAAVPFWRAQCRRRGWVDEPGGRKDHGAIIPLAGGPAILTGMLIVLLAGILAVLGGLLTPDATRLLSHGLGRRSVPLAAILAGAVGMVMLGWWDDTRELRAGPKFAGQLLIALIVAAAGVRLTLFVPSLIFSYGVTILWILTLTNAVNFLDNMNGLCAGIGLIASGWLAFIAIHNGQYLVALLALVVCGALLGFLPYNFPRASVFLGDSGSHLVGYLLAVLAILPHFYTREHPDRSAVLSPLAILAVPLVDLVQVVAVRWRQGRPFWLGDQNHLSHRLVRAGFTRIQTVVMLWLAALLSGAITLW